MNLDVNIYGKLVVHRYTAGGISDGIEIIFNLNNCGFKFRFKFKRESAWNYFFVRIIPGSNYWVALRDFQQYNCIFRNVTKYPSIRLTLFRACCGAIGENFRSDQCNASRTSSREPTFRSSSPRRIPSFRPSARFGRICISETRDWAAEK